MKQFVLALLFVLLMSPAVFAHGGRQQVTVLRVRNAQPARAVARFAVQPSRRRPVVIRTRRLAVVDTIPVRQRVLFIAPQPRNPRTTIIVR